MEMDRWLGDKWMDRWMYFVQLELNSTLFFGSWSQKTLMTKMLVNFHWHDVPWNSSLKFKFEALCSKAEVQFLPTIHICDCDSLRGAVLMNCYFCKHAAVFTSQDVFLPSWLQRCHAVVLTLKQNVLMSTLYQGTVFVCIHGGSVQLAGWCWRWTWGVWFRGRLSSGITFTIAEPEGATKSPLCGPGETLSAAPPTWLPQRRQCGQSAATATSHRLLPPKKKNAL